MESASLPKKTGAGWKLLALLAAFAATDAIPRMANFITYRTGLSDRFFTIDPNRVFAGLFLHHIIQGLIALAVLLLFSLLLRKPIREFGFNMDQWRWSLKTTGYFCIGWVLFAILGMVLSPPQSLGYPQSLRNIIGYQLFELTMPGPSEETLFRALPYFILGFVWTGSVRVVRLKFSHKAIIATVFFMIAHIGFTYIPFHISYINPTQQVLALGLGLFYGYMFDKTGSLLGPVLVHAASDFIVTLAEAAAVLLTQGPIR